MQLRQITSFICKQHGWVDGRRCPECGTQPRPGDPCYHRAGTSTTYSCYRPPRPRTMSPVQYYRKYGVVDDRYHYVWRGWYYCNPAHCKRRWRSKTRRDAHLDMAYGALG